MTQKTVADSRKASSGLSVQEPVTLANGSGTSVVLTVLLILLGISLNHASVIGRFNLSVADIIAPVVLVVLAATGRVAFPRRATLFFLVVLIQGIFIGAYVTPIWSGAETTMGVISGVIKLLASFIYFVVGYSLLRYGLAQPVLRGFVVGAVFIGTFGVASLLGIPVPGTGSMLFGGFRFIGLMNDPNYFSIVQCAALAILLTSRMFKSLARTVAALILAVSVLASGSKTGAIVLIAVALWFTVALLRRPGVAKRSGLLALKLLAAFLCLLVVVWAFAPTLFNDLISSLQGNRSIDRISSIFGDLGEAANQDGSSRGNAWQQAIELFQMSPVFGVGVGAYGSTAGAVFGNPVLAHNTFLQLLVEWGLPLTVYFFGWVLTLLFGSKRVTFEREVWVIGRNVLAVFLVGSMAISLNNARLFWLALGIVAAGYLDKAKSTSLTSER